MTSKIEIESHLCMPCLNPLDDPQISIFFNLVLFAPFGSNELFFLASCDGSVTHVASSGDLKQKTAVSQIWKSKIVENKFARKRK